jgi:hypothetical protein
MKEAEAQTKIIGNTIKFTLETKLLAPIAKGLKPPSPPSAGEGGYDPSLYGNYEENGKFYIIDKDGKREYFPVKNETMEYGYYEDTSTGIFWYYDENGMTPYTPLEV